MYVVFANGEFIGAFKTLDEVRENLKSLRPKPTHAIVLKVGEDVKPRGVLEWWGGSIELKSV